MCRRIFIILSIFVSLLVIHPCNLAAKSSTSSRKTKFNVKNETPFIGVKRLKFKKFPKAFNPSILATDEGFILTFRHIPHESRLWISNIGVVMLDSELNPIGDPQVLDTRFGATKKKTPRQAEDAKIFSCKGKIYLSYNDNLKDINPTANKRRDIYIAELSFNGEKFFLSNPIKLFHKDKYATVKWQKNWVPFVWNDKLLFGYSIVPHEVLDSNLQSGECTPLHTTKANSKWKLGTLRGSSSAQIVDGEYLAFFHSGIITKSESSNNRSMWHYYMGAYTFQANPPFALTRMSPKPFVGDKFYSKSSYEKRVIFPGGFVVKGNKIYVAYGKDDSQVWIAIFDKQKLMSSLKSVKTKK